MGVVEAQLSAAGQHVCLRRQRDAEERRLGEAQLARLRSPVVAEAARARLHAYELQISLPLEAAKLHLYFSAMRER